MGFRVRAWRFLTKPRGSPLWDRIIRLTGILGALGIPIALFVPGSGPLLSFLLVTVWVNGPLGTFLPATYEPILMLYGRLYPPLLVAALGTVGVLAVEVLNYHVYRAVLRLEVLRRFRESLLIRKTLEWFERAPFFTVWLCSWSIFPYWAIRILSPLAGYPLRKQLLATLLGRFPRLWFFAALGVWWDVSLGVLASIAGASVLLAVVLWGARRGRKPGGEAESEGPVLPADAAAGAVGGPQPQERGSTSLVGHASPSDGSRRNVRSGWLRESSGGPG